MNEIMWHEANCMPVGVLGEGAYSGTSKSVKGVSKILAIERPNAEFQPEVFWRLFQSSIYASESVS